MISRAAAVLFLTALTGCVSTTYTDYRARSDDAPLLGRQVAVYRVADYSRPPPSCAIVMPAEGDAAPGLRRVVEDAVHRHLAAKLPRVVGPVERARRVRRLAIDIRRADGRAILVRATRCPVLARARILDSSEDFVLVWSRKNLNLEIALARDGVAIWKARHDAARSDGGLPLSPISAPLAIVQAARLHGDDDVMLSLVDDAVRRIFAALPDMR